MRYLFCFLVLCSAIFAQPPKVVVFDYGGVVAKIDRKPILQFLSRSLNYPYSKVEEDFADEKLYGALNQTSSYWRKYAIQTLSTAWFQELDHHRLLLAQPSPGMRQLIQKLKAQGIQVALLSNTNPHRAYFLTSWGAYDLFNPVLLSSNLGVRKPNLEIYRQLLHRVQVAPEDCLFIDNQSKNVDSAIMLGIDGIVFESVEQLKEELRKREIVL